MDQTIPKILVIEDNEILRSTLLEVLAFEGYSAKAADNGLTGLRQIYQFRPDLIICDVMMPEMDGYEVLKRVRETLGMALVRFIFLTAKTQHEDLRRGMETGADDYLTKPYTTTSLLKAIQQQLAKQQVLRAEADKKLNDLRGELIAALPHELRTPLTSLVGFIDLLVEEPNGFSASQTREILLTMQDASRRMWRLTENYVVYCQIMLSMSDERQRQNIFAQSMNRPNEIIESTVSGLATKHERFSDQRLSLSDDVDVAMSENDLKKIVYELVDNAFKFSNSGQPVTITTYHDHAQFVIEITDSGRGMSPEQIEQIGAYKQFNRAHYEQQGLGLGLTIARLLAELHGGKLIAESALDGPTRITVVLLRVSETLAT